MTYNIELDKAPLKVDFLNQVNLSGTSIVFGLPSTYNTDITATTTTFTLYSGSSYYLEARISATNFNQNGAITWQFYSDTDSAFLGSNTTTNFANGGVAGAARVGRRVASALILDSDISTNKTLRVHATVTGSGWIFNEYLSLSHIGRPTIMVMQLPS